MKGRLTPSIPLLCLLGLSTGLRFYRLSGQSLWADEGNSVALARRSLAEIAQRTAFDIHPPFYYWLLKLWVLLFGDSEAALRSLSAILGVGLIYLIWLLGNYLFGRRVGTIAALIAALSPLQVYYSQEARMYLLLAFLGSLTLLLTFLILDETYQSRRTWFGLIYILGVTAGLYTHYAYPLILLIINLIAVAILVPTLRVQVALLPGDSPVKSGTGESQGSGQRGRWLLPPSLSLLIIWLGLQLIPLCLYLPWLPVTWRQLTTWPSEPGTPSLMGMIETVASTLFLGLSWPYGGGWAAAIALFLLLLASSFIRPLHQGTILLWLWLLLPVLLTLLIYSPAFLKFLLMASPPLALLVALVLDHLATSLKGWPGSLLAGALLLILLGLSGLSLVHYYTDPTYARDNYRGLVQFIKAVSGPQDAVILNAEGQQDVFSYYAQDYHLEAPVYPLPRHRPLAEGPTLAELEQVAATASEVYGVYWATHQADPEGLIEGWLNTHLFKASDQWYGNVRLVSYAVPQTQPESSSMNPLEYQFGSSIQLLGYSVAETGIQPGNILQVALQWQALEPLLQNYTVFLQVLDSADHVVGQRDAQPLLPTRDWQIGESVFDIHGVFIEPGTPPGPHRLIVGLYDQETGQRLPVSRGTAALGDFAELEPVEIVPPAPLLPRTAFTFQTPLEQPLGGLTLLGYDLYPLGHRSSPETPLSPGAPVQLVVYWQLNQPLSSEVDQLLIEVVTNKGEKTPVSTVQPLAGVDYPVEVWQIEEIVRAQYIFFLSDLSAGTYRLALTLNGQTVTTKPFRISG